MRLVYEKTGKPVEVGQKVKVDDKTMAITRIEKPRHGGSTGRVYLDNGGSGLSYYPSVVGAKWIEREDQ